MSATNDSPGEQPGKSTDTGVTAGEQPQSESIDVNDLTAEQLLEGLTGQAPDPDNEAPAPPKAEASEQPPKQEAEAQAPKTAEAPASKPPGRLSVRALPADQQLETAEALALVREGKAKDLLDAIQQVRGVQAPPAAAKETEEAAPDVDEVDQDPPTQPSTVTEIQSNLAQLREERKQAGKDYDQDEVDRLTNEIEDTLISLQEAKANAAQEQQAQERQEAESVSYNEKYQAAVDELEAQFPDTLDDDSKFSQLLDDKITAARVRNDPALEDPRFILGFAAEIKELLTPAPSGRAPTAPPPAKRPTGESVAPGHTQAIRPTQDQIKAQIDAADPDDILAALTAGDRGY